MVAQVGALRVTVGADITGLQTGMKRAERQVQASASVMQRSVDGINKSFKGLGSIGALSLGAAGALAAGSAFLRIADAAKSMTAQLKLATAEYGSFSKAQKDVRAIAEGSRASLTATAELYSAIQRNAGELGNTQAQTARITETVSKSFVVFGASADEAANATRQLIQAFQSGRLQGDEFRSLMENAPRLVKILAESLGVTTGELRKMSAEGELTADKLVAAFSDLKLTAQLDKEFAAMPVTFDQAMTGVYNAAIIVFSAFDRGGQFSNSIASFVSQGTEGFSSLEQSAFDFGQQVGDLFSAFEEVRHALADLSSEGVGGFLDLTSAGGDFRNMLAEILGLADGVANAFANLYNAPGNIIRLVRGEKLVLDPSNMRAGFVGRAGASSGTALGAAVGSAIGDFRPKPNPPPFRPPAGKTKKPKAAKKPPRDRSDDVAYQFENELRQAQMDILRASQELAGTVGDRAELSLQMLDLEAQQNEAELKNNVRKAQRDLAEGKITETTFREVEAHAEALRAKQQETYILKAQAIMQEAVLHRMERADALAERGYQNQIDGLQFDDEMATTQAEHRKVQLEIVDTLYKQKEAHLRALKAQLEFAGKIEEAADVQAEIDQLPAERARERERVMKGTRGPLEDWAASIPQTAAQINEALQSIEAEGLQGLSDAIADVISGTKSLSEAFGDMARQIIADIIRMTVRMLVFKAISSLFGGIFGGGSSTPDLSSLYAGVPSDLVPKFATGGSFTVLGQRGLDKNLLSLNGVPIANVSHGERIGVQAANDGGGPSRMIVELRDEMLEARIASGADVQIVRAYPTIQASVVQTIDQRTRRR